MTERAAVAQADRQHGQPHANGLAPRAELQMLEAIGEAVVVVDPSWRITLWNAACEALYGWSREEALGHSPLPLLVPEEEHAKAQALQARVSAGEPARDEVRLRRRDGTPVSVLLTLAPLRGPDGGITGIIGVGADLTTQQQGRRLIERRARQQQLVAELGQAALAGEPPEDLVERARRQLASLLEASTELVPVSARMAHADPPSAWVPVGARLRLAVRTRHDALDEQDHAFLQAVGNALSAAEERRSAREQLERVASHDVVTGLPNRVLLMDRLERAQAAASRTAAPMGLLFLDLDGFKHINDALGHDVGDRILRRVADRLRRVIRSQDTVARFGGDEFVILCPDLPDPEAVTGIAERVQRAFASPFVADGAELTLTASVGVVVGDQERDGAALLRDADTAMYAAKERGRNQHAVFSPAMRERVRERVDTADALRKALDGDGVVVRYQPIVSLHDERLVGAEALVRLALPDGSTLSPDRFIWVAEEVGLIHELGEAVVRRACADAAAWVARDPTLRVAVNLSPLQLADERLVDRITRALREAGLAPTNLALEITESAVLQTTGAEALLTELRSLGIELALDDFGTGYSALNHLRLLPVDVVKIDRSFVAGLCDEPTERALVGATVDLAHAFALAATAEGVETATQRDELARIGCDHAQGFLWSPPLDAADLTALQARGASAPRAP